MSNIEQEKELKLSVRLSGKAAIRGEKIQSIQQQAAQGFEVLTACRIAKTCEGSYKRWLGRLNHAVQKALTDQERSGRPNREDARERIFHALAEYRKRMKVLQVQLGAMDGELEALGKAVSELLEKQEGDLR